MGSQQHSKWQLTTITSLDRQSEMKSNQCCRAGVYLGTAEALQKQSRHFTLPLKVTLRYTHVVLCLSQCSTFQQAHQRKQQRDGQLVHRRPLRLVQYGKTSTGSSSLYETLQTTHQELVFQLYNIWPRCCSHHVDSALCQHADTPVCHHAVTWPLHLNWSRDVSGFYRLIWCSDAAAGYQFNTNAKRTLVSN